MLTKLIITWSFYFVILTSGGLLRAQNYNFTNYSLKEGLPQSQVSVIFQAKDRTLWLGSFGGVSNFDGLTFKSYSKADGLLSNNVTAIAEDHKNRIWIGSDNGINILEHDRIKTVYEGIDVHNLQNAPNGVLWGVSNRKLFRLVNQKVEFVEPIKGESVTCISKDLRGNLYAFVHSAGIFKLNGDRWQLHTVFPAIDANSYIVKILFDNGTDRIFAAALRKGVFLIDKGTVTTFYKNNEVQDYLDIALDRYHNLWIATPRGVCLVNAQKKATFFNEHNGLKSGKVNSILSDVEDNLWIAIFGEGLFRYEGSAFIKYDKFKGRDLSFAISGLTLDSEDNLWISTFNKGLFKFDGENVTQPKADFLKDNNVYFVTRNRAKEVLFSVQNHGLWRYKDGKFAQMPLTKGRNIAAVAQDELGNYYSGEFSSVAYLTKNKVDRISGFKGWTSCLLYHNKDSVILGTSSGAYLIKNKEIDHRFEIKALKNAYVTTVIKFNDLLLFGTLGEGLVSYDISTKLVQRYLTSSGLNSNDIYSLTTDHNHTLWIGSGRGINKMQFNPALKAFEIIKGNSPIVEANQNAILNYKEGVLVGTTEGVIFCNTGLNEKVKAPSISLKKIAIYDKTDKKRNAFLFEPKEEVVLNHTQSHVSIGFRGVSLSAPQAIVYRYYLEGIDHEFGEPTSVTEAEYSVLMPGRYTFKVYAEVNGEKSEVKKFAFVIKPPFYATFWFKILVPILLLLVIWMVFNVILRRKEAARKQREKIKLEEQTKIRKQTAEDFHDDIGNKLTRINVLSELLDKKIDSKQSEQKQLIKMIKENAGFLYTGTKDILWALDPKSDNLFEIMQHIKNFGEDLFQHSNIDFKMDEIPHIYLKWYMSMEQNRNITLIFKEILTNALKHANAKNIGIKILNNDNKANIEVIDDGCGFDLDNLKYGRGLKNIHSRCQRINATLNIKSGKGMGTKVLISNIKFYGNRSDE